MTPKEKLMAAVAAPELISKVFMRAELVNKMVSSGLNSLSREELNALHALDREVSGYDLSGAFFDRDTRMQKFVLALYEQNEKLVKALEEIRSPHDIVEALGQDFDWKRRKDVFDRAVITRRKIAIDVLTQNATALLQLVEGEP